MSTGHSISTSNSSISITFSTGCSLQRRSRPDPAPEGYRMRARVFVTLKPSVFDPQGRTIAEALHSLGYAGVENVRQGKFFELDLQTTDAPHAKALAAEVADRVLANPVIESYRVEVD